MSFRPSLQEEEMNKASSQYVTRFIIAVIAVWAVLALVGLLFFSLKWGIG